MMLLAKNQIYLNQNLGNKNEVINFIAKKAYELGIVENQSKLEQELWKREKEYSTAVQDLFAIPHSKSKNVKESKIFLIKLENKIDWESEDGYKVKVIFPILVPENEANVEYIKILSTLATNLLEDDFKKKILEINDENELLNYIENILEVTL